MGNLRNILIETKQLVENQGWFTIPVEQRMKWTQNFVRERGEKYQELIDWAGGDSEFQGLLNNYIEAWNMKEVHGSLEFNGMPIDDLGSLEIVHGNLSLEGTDIEDLGNLREVGGHLDISATAISTIRDLGNLSKVGGHLKIAATSLLDIPDVQHDIYAIVQVSGSVSRS